MTERIMVIGNSGSGKTTLALQTAQQWPRIIFINTQHFHVPPGFFPLTITGEPDPEYITRALMENPKVEITHVHTFSLDKFWFILKDTIMKGRQAGTWTEPCVIVVDEISTHNVTGKLSSPVWYTDALTRSRIWTSVILLNHSVYQIPNFTFNQLTRLVFMRVGDAAAEWQYIEKWFPGLLQLREDLTDYRYVVYDIKHSTYSLFEPTPTTTEAEQEPEPDPEPPINP